MANDLSNPVNATAAQGHDGFFDHGTGTDSLFGTVQLAQADGGAAQATPGQTIHVTPPQDAAGPVVIRVEVAPGSIVELPQPFDADAALAAKEGDGNLAIRVGDVTVILQGYVVAANDPEHPVTIEGADGKPIDIATILASTDPAIDIQTAAGPGDQGGQGADNTGAILAQLAGGNGLGGLESVGGQDQTELGYSLIDGGLRQEFATTTLAASNVFGFSVGAFPGAISEGFLRDPAQTAELGGFDDFMIQYKDAVENPGNPMYAGWADFNGTNATGGDFAEYLGQTSKITTVDAQFTGGTGDLVLTGIADGVTSNGSHLSFEPADGGHTLFVRRDEATATDTGNALVAVVHVEGPDANGQFTIQTILINRLDHPDAGKDEMSLEVQFKVYDGPAPNSQPHEGEGTGDEGAQSPSIEGSFKASFADDVPILESVTYHNQHDGKVAARESEGSGSDVGLIDEDWLHGGSKDKDTGTSGDTGGGTCVTGCIKVNFGADGAALLDGATEKKEQTDKHAFVLDTTTYHLGQDFPYGATGLSSGGQPLKVLSVGPDHLTVGIEDTKQQLVALVEGDETPSEPTDPIPGRTIFTLTLNQDTGQFEFDLKGPLDHGTPSDAIFGDETGLNALTVEAPATGTEETISLAFGVTAVDDDGDKVQAEIDIDVNDDVPIARNDSDHVDAGTHAAIAGNVITAAGEDSLSGKDSQGGDHAHVTGVAVGSVSGDQSGHVGDELHGDYGTLTLNADGSYTYTRNAGSKGGVDDVFTYTLTDGDGDKSTATLTIHIQDSGVCIALPTCPADTTVDEAGLPARGAEPAGSDAASDSEQTGGTVTITAKDGIQSLDIAGHELTLGALKDLGTTPLKITDSTGELTLTGFNEGTGALTYTYVLKDNTSGEGQSVSFDIKVKDIDGDEGTATLTIKIVDDEPTANCDEISAVAGKSADIQFIVDVSGSMKDTGFNVPGTYPDNGIGLERYAMAQMLSTHPEVQNVQFVLFSDHSSHSVWMTAAQALTYLQNSNNFPGGGNTDYDKALTEAMSALGGARPLPQGDQTLVYFFSDGDPNQPNHNEGIDNDGSGSNVSQAEWETFVDKHGITNVFTVGIGSVTSGELAELTPISYPNIDTAPTNHEDNFINITSSNVSTLTASLGNLVSPPSGPITGNVTTNDASGADGYGSPKVVSATYDSNPFELGVEHDLGAGRGKLLLNADGTYTYTPPAGNGNGTPFYVEYTIQDGDGDTATAKLKIDLKVAPEVDLDAGCEGNNATASFVEDQPVPTLIAPAGIVSDDGTIGSMTVTLTNRPDGDATERLTIDPAAVPAGLTATYVNGVLTITGSASALIYQTVLRSIVYENTSQNPNGADRTVTVSVKDQEATPLTSITHIVTVSVTAVNDAPDANIVPVSFNVNEQTDLTLSGPGRMSISDADSGNDNVTVTLKVTEGELNVTKGNSGVDSVSGNGTSTVTIVGTVAEINKLLAGTGQSGTGKITYNDDTDTPAGSVELKLTVNDNGQNGIGGAKSDFATATILVANTNDKPVTDLNGSGKSGSDNTASFTEDKPAVAIAPSATITDDSGKLVSMTVTLTNHPDSSAESLALNGTAQSAATGAGLTVTAYNAVTGMLTISGASAVDASVFQTILRGIVYNNTSQAPDDDNRTVTVTVKDAGNLVSDSHTITVSVDPVNDGPVATITPLTFNAVEETALVLSGKGLSISDVDAGNGTMTVTLKVGEGELNISKGSTGVTVNNNGSETVTLTGTVTQINNLLDGKNGGVVEYRNDDNAPAAQVTLTLKVDDNGHTGGGPDLTASDTAIIYIQNTPEAPAACDDNVITNAGSNVFNIPEWALTYNDSDEDTPNSSLDLISGASAVFNAGTKDTVGHTDGTGSAGHVSFTDSSANNGSFDYKVTDGTQTATGHVTVTQDTGTLTGSSGDDIVVVYGSTGATVNADGGNDIILGGSGNDTLNGESGNDLIYGGAGNDKLDGGSGTDLIFGEAGHDTMFYTSNSNSAGDKFDGGDGFDRVLVNNNSAVSLTYDASKLLNVEMIDLGDASDRSGSGSQHSLALNAADVGVHNYGTINGHQISLFVIGDTSGSNSNSRDDVNMTGFTNMNVNGNFADAVTGATHNFDLYKSATDANIVVAVEHNLG